MKRFFGIVLVCLAFIPALTLGACSKKENASAVKNKIYYVTKVISQGKDISKAYTDANMKIIFYKENFIVEYNHKESSNYGYYLGNFTTKDLNITLNVTEAGGIYKNYQTDAEKKASVFSSLRYTNKKLYTEFAYNGTIYSFTLEEKSDK